MLLSQDEARFPLVPTLHVTLGVKGHRPLVGTWDNKDLVYGFAALNLVTGQWTTRLLDQPSHSKVKTGRSKQPRLQMAFVGHLRDMARMYPAPMSPEVVITIDHAPWHRGVGVEQVLVAHPHLRLSRLPSYSPQLKVNEASPQQAAGYQTEGPCRGDTTVSPPSSLCKVTSEQAPRNLLIERWWRVLRRRATPNRLFASMAALRMTLRNNISYFQTMRQKVLSLIESPRKAKKEAKVSDLRQSRRLAKGGTAPSG